MTAVLLLVAGAWLAVGVVAVVASFKAKPTRRDRDGHERRRP